MVARASNALQGRTYQNDERTTHENIVKHFKDRLEQG
jgi:hypothetical protein